MKARRRQQAEHMPATLTLLAHQLLHYQMVIIRD